MNIYNASQIGDKNVTALIYAPPGMGKTTTIKYFAGKTLVLDIDRTSDVLKGNSNIDICKIDNIKTWEDWSKTITDLCASYKGKYDNIVVDNISELERCILSDLGSQGKNKGVPCQADYQYMQFKLVNSLRYMKNLDCNIIWTAWEASELYTESTGQQFNRSYPQINGKILNNVCGLCDIVGRLTINTEGNRGFILSATNSTYAKNQVDNRKGCLQEELLKIES
jgi:phage nucleotide-binding protein